MTTKHHELPVLLDKKELALGLILYKNILPKNLNLIEKLENILSKNKIYKWRDSTVGYREKIPEYRDCLDFKFKGTLINQIDKDSQEIKNIWDECYNRMNLALQDYCGVYQMEPLNFWEAINLVKYYPGNHFSEHADDGASYKSVVSLVGYLNDDYEGGEIYFRLQDIKIKPEAGDLIIFPSNYLFPHQALPVKSGIKYSMVTMTDYSDKFHSTRFYYDK